MAFWTIGSDRAYIRVGLRLTPLTVAVVTSNNLRSWLLLSCQRAVIAKITQHAGGRLCPTNLCTVVALRTWVLVGYEGPC